MGNTRVTDKMLEKPYFSRVGIIKEIICEQSHAKSSREFILLELFCCDYWRIDDDRAVAKRRGGSCARFADNPYKLTCNPRK